MICSLLCGCADVSLCNPFLADVLFGSNKGLLNVSIFVWKEIFHKALVALFSKTCFPPFYCLAVQTALLGPYFWQSVPVGRNIQRSFQRSSSKWFLNRNPCAQCGRSFDSWVVLQLRDPVFPQVKHTPSVTIGGGCGHWVSIERIFVCQCHILISILSRV